MKLFTEQHLVGRPSSAAGPAAADNFTQNIHAPARVNTSRQFTAV